MAQNHQYLENKAKKVSATVYSTEVDANSEAGLAAKHGWDIVYIAEVYEQITLEDTTSNGLAIHTPGIKWLVVLQR